MATAGCTSQWWCVFVWLQFMIWIEVHVQYQSSPYNVCCSSRFTFKAYSGSSSCSLFLFYNNLLTMLVFCNFSMMNVKGNVFIRNYDYRVIPGCLWVFDVIDECSPLYIVRWNLELQDVGGGYRASIPRPSTRLIRVSLCKIPALLHFIPMPSLSLILILWQEKGTLLRSQHH